MCRLDFRLQRVTREGQIVEGEYILARGEVDAYEVRGDMLGLRVGSILKMLGFIH